MRRTGIVLFAALLLIGAAGSAWATDPVRALGAHGEVFSVLSGTYGDLVPDGSEDRADSQVLALKVERPDGSSTLSVVPATFGPDLDISAALVLEPDSNRRYLLWQSWSGMVSSRLLVASLDAGGWSEAIEVSDEANAWKSSPVLLVTRDSFRTLSHDGPTTVQRTVAHVIWSQELPAGGYDTLYAPLVLEGGRYIGVHPVVNLNDLLPESGFGVPAPFAATSAQVRPYLRSAGDGSSVIAAFLDPYSGRLAAIELSLVPGELPALGDSIEDTVTREGQQRDLSSPGGVARVVDEARHQLIDFGARLEIRSEFLGMLAAEVETEIRNRAGGGQGIASVAAGARHQLIDFGARLSRENLRRADAGARHQLIDFGATQGPDHRRQVVQARSVIVDTPVAKAAAVPVPGGDVRLYCSRDGESFLVAWVAGASVEYRETRTDDWSSTLRLALDEKMSSDSAFSILEKRIHTR